jgi:Tubulin-tyrosine ligase family
MIIHSLKAIKGKLKFRKYTFELVGYDFILDEDLQSYIIEVNTNPCIEESSQLLKTLVPRMLDDMFKITVDTVFNSSGSNPPERSNLSQFHVPGYEDSVNMWEHIYTYV